ncbi:MAG TPA: MASE1 domain-containing protein [Verrucomicrobiae bacterium]|nr:MASE1 domain-containing protein [Verrucomicrobiae bacterium]
MVLRRVDLAGEGLRLAVVGVAYFISAELGLQLALVHGQVTPVWPPTGIALVAVLVFGPRIWPAIAVAALAVNLPIGPNPLGAACIALGNTLAPLTAAMLMKQAGFQLELNRLVDAVALILLGALTGMAVSATVGSLVLVVSGAVPVSSFAQTWAVWWTGDAMGVLLVAPFLLSFRPKSGKVPLQLAERVELAALLGAVALVTFFVFQNQLRLEYLVFPLIMLAALRFRLRGSAPAALIASGVAVWAAVSSTGPFAEETLLEKMVTLQVFNVFVALASLVLASYIATREREREARISSEAKSEFLRVAAHELRGPLSVLSGYLSLLASGDLGTPPERWKGPLDILTAKTWELDKIMDDLLEVVRLDGHRAAGTRHNIDLREVVEAAAERAHARADLTGAQISVEQAGAMSVHADAEQVGHIVDNLINNALSYAHSPARVAVTSAVEGDRAVVRFSDNGVGIPVDMRDSIFEPFRRAHQPGFEQVPGTGLGLYISRELAVSHGGSLVLEKSSPEGSTFTLSLPLTAVAVRQPG